MMSILAADPVLTDDASAEGTAEHDVTKAALRKYWMSFGFPPAHGGYLVFDDVVDVLE
ncbi:hypothetical protein [Pseudarthrobacter sp. fls2-241-R2A-127]|uniref:hypothetical protein n=1 Tax=Pseudarthrobacter sp. fls2-241-R2A-127 TaxID=3040303 RepID=UPI0025550CFB|nr:hypothetical protein [Pseudarthrobacter sp. fls2-241-R2A-127]